MLDLSQWNEAQKDEIVRYQAENKALTERKDYIHTAGHINVERESIEKQQIYQRKTEILAYVSENLNIHSYKELKDTAKAITHERALTKEFEQQLGKHYELTHHERPAESRRKLTPYEEFERQVAEEQRRQNERGQDHDQTQGHEH